MFKIHRDWFPKNWPTLNCYATSSVTVPLWRNVTRPVLPPCVATPIFIDLSAELVQINEHRRGRQIWRSHVRGILSMC
jgi:hypothetical protein